MPKRSVFLSALFGLAFATAALAQSGVPSADRIIRFNGSVAGASAGAQTLRFAVYDEETGGTLLWEEVQTAAVDATGNFTVFLGGTSTDGLPVALFANGAPRWLSVEQSGTAAGPRVLLAAVPYAVSAANATSLGGRPAADYLLTPQARAAAAAAAGTSGAAADREPLPLVNNGTANFIGKFFNNVDLINSQLFDNGTNVGVGTTNPFDKFHTQFTNAGGTQTGYAVQNLSGGANAYSGMLFYDHTGALRQFQGYNNSTGEYRINNISPTASINFMTGSVSRFLVDNSGRIGLGVTSPATRLHLLSTAQSGVTIRGTRISGTEASPAPTGGNNHLLLLEGTGYDTASYQVGAALRMYSGETWTPTAQGTYMVFDTTVSGTNSLSEKMRIHTNGNVGIGINSPVRARLEVAVGGTYDFGTRGILNTGGASTSASTGTTANNSIFADGFIWSDATFAISDARIKNIKGRSNGASDLATLMGVKITDYAYIDTMVKGTGLQKKVIAQELEEVFPQAVRRGLNVVPDVYAMGTMSDGWVMLATNLKKGERVRLHIGPTSDVYEVLEVGKDRFRSSLTGANGTAVFVYGREVDDFRVVDYEAVSMLNVSATQELYRKLQQQETETAALRQEIADMRTALMAALEAVAAAKVRQ